MFLPADFGQRPESSGSHAEDMRRNLIQRRGHRAHHDLLVGRMACRGSVREVTAQLRDGAGIETVLADTRWSMVWLSGTTTAPDVLEPLSRLRYDPEVLDDP